MQMMGYSIQKAYKIILYRTIEDKINADIKKIIEYYQIDDKTFNALLDAFKDERNKRFHSIISRISFEEIPCQKTTK